MVLLYIDRILIPAAVVPAIVLLVKIYQADRQEKEPIFYTQRRHRTRS